MATSPPGLNHIRARVPPRLRWPRASHYRPLSGSRTRGDARPSRFPLCQEVGRTRPGALEADGDTIQANPITSRAYPATSAAPEASPPQSITHNRLLGADSGSQGHRSSLGQNRSGCSHFRAVETLSNPSWLTPPRAYGCSARHRASRAGDCNFIKLTDPPGVDPAEDGAELVDLRGEGGRGAAIRARPGAFALGA